jgi:hypothetical protein
MIARSGGVGASASKPARRGVAADSGGAPEVAQRPWPYPYRAALAVCSDLDETPTAEEYFEMVRFLNTSEATRFGRGVDLEVGNSIYFDMPPAQFSYWNANEAARVRVRALIRSGHIDSLHSFGDLASTREHAGRALDELARHACELRVWIDHAVAPSNFGGDIMRGLGDVAGSPVYHADLTCAFGVEYVWRGRVTSVVGQDVRRSLRGIASGRHPIASGVTVAKEAAKGLLGRRGHAKYAPHAANEVLWKSSLRSGHAVTEFLRSNPSWAGISLYETADGFGRVVTDRFVDRLVGRGAACVLYTHLGKIRTKDRALTPETRVAFDRLARAFGAGELLVTTTRRLLDWCALRRRAPWAIRCDGEAATIDVSAPGGLRAHRALDGLTFYVPRPDRTRLTINGRDATLRMNPADETGMPSVSLPWRRLAFPRL